jgi:hypothetical protein
MQSRLRVYETTKHGHVTVLKSTITHISSHRLCRLTSVRTIIGLDDSHLLKEVTFDNVIVQVFPFSLVRTFDISDINIIILLWNGNIVITEKTTGHVVHTILNSLASCVHVCPSGKYIIVNKDYCSGNVLLDLYSTDTGLLVRTVPVAGNYTFVRQFISDTHLIIHKGYCLTSMLTMLDISNGKEEVVRLPKLTPLITPVSGQYLYCVVNKTLCAYE